MSDNRFKLMLFAFLAIFAVFVFFTGKQCFDTGSAANSLSEAGYTDIRIGGIAYCGRDDIGHSFTARNREMVVSGRVCCNVFGSCYTRF